MKTKIKIPYNLIAEFCNKYHILKLSLFGSVLRDDFGPDSDIDMLVDFEPEHLPGLFRLAGMEIELGEALGREIELRTLEDLSRYFRDKVAHSAKVIYERR